ncbi:MULTISPECIES: tRNA lysidine(34) synthetase TilS [unclassified Thermosynechococcus]|uniref:tRNA lysidine(34) synthetase TilS n=1 Tax=unclassified Thermosynechococcus TaxID=2622553 RepID=UPI002873B1ED|nr:MULTISPECIES: tRNA lysidine(34) synthetase TilS [unclassified Thermosynechococcus]WNC32679.1 tRNA lysidine(34) synthetase TilS [Thermosynechococcus sp. PKX95]WNC36255.1 tRNA lysidine(34) synthetase TilS [Thermosynechococcus sp. PKX91]WNC37726.1 tRNA lysidine(34) synthetase TilS [Thermosynechococcus sp. WL11]WNC40247.1 tRNA lysidine(34) synthetase TilS [Thermosynechococcus sp. WL17]WNC42767.1 tRNA lysidine(34) synthetase TilS [Thermosynechococcus sp. WL15]
MWGIYHARLHTTLKTQQWLPRGARILIALSGGQDSVCLTRLLLDLQPYWRWFLAAVHCDHRWRADSAANANFVQALAQQWHLPCEVVSAPEMSKTEAAARSWRYQVFETVAKALDCTHVVTAHTQSDRAESLLLHLLRGTSPDGLATLLPSRALGAIQLVRPLLGMTRAETATFCQTYGLPVWQDATNHHLNYRRNRLRLELIPYLQAHFNPNVEEVLAQTAELLASDRAYFEAEVERLAPTVIREHPPALERLRLRELPLALQRRLIQRFLRQHLKRGIDFSLIEAVRPLITAGNGSQTSTLPGGYHLRVCGQWLELIRPTAPPPESVPADQGERSPPLLPLY